MHGQHYRPAEVHPLPERVMALLRALNAPPRLLAHLALVHDMAHRLTQELAALWPALPYDRQVVLLGAATHDVGKVAHPGELAGAGNRHEVAGPGLLRTHGFPEEVARIARTHGRWDGEPAPNLEDLLVAVADAVWKGSRDERLARIVVHALSAATGEVGWTVHMRLDDVLTKLSDGAEQRLQWYANQPV